jgi:hypothetical protein
VRSHVLARKGFDVFELPTQADEKMGKVGRKKDPRK